MRIDTSTSNDVTVTPFILLCIVYVGMDEAKHVLGHSS